MRRAFVNGNGLLRKFETSKQPHNGSRFEFFSIFPTNSKLLSPSAFVVHNIHNIGYTVVRKYQAIPQQVDSNGSVEEVNDNLLNTNCFIIKYTVVNKLKMSLVTVEVIDAVQRTLEKEGLLQVSILLCYIDCY